jgi:hypothetical protein
MFRRLKENAFVNRMLGSQRDRVILSASMGLSLNLAYAVYHGVLGFCSRSLWFLLLGAYYILLSVMRFGVVRYDAQNRKNDDSLSPVFLLRFLGILFLTLAVILAFSVYWSFRYDVSVQYQEIMMITIATYTFYKITAAAIHAAKARRQQSVWLIALRNIGCADAAASLLTLQRSMLVSFEGMSGENMKILNALTGAGVCILIAVLGIDMMKRRKKQHGKIKVG